MAFKYDNGEDIKGKVKFHEGPHTYENEKGQQYLSVTQLIGKFKNKFDPKQQALDSTSNPNSKYFGRDPKEVEREWAKAGDDARVRGTKFHKGKEDVHNEQAKVYRQLTPQQRHIIKANPAMIIPPEDSDVMTDYTELPDGEYSELILWSHRWKIAGIADKVIIDGEFFDIEDYKTNKEIRMTSYFKRGQGYQMLKFPLDHIMDCSFYHYEIQLSIYAYLFAALSGKKPRNLTILHHPTKSDGTVEQKETRYSCTYRKHDLMTMFNMWGGYAPPDFKPHAN